jgi:threonine dehydratase
VERIVVDKSGLAGFGARVDEAAQAVRTLFAETPLQENEHLSRKTGARVFLKREDLTPVRSYKIRGAYNFFRKALARPDAPQSFVCASAGNHAQGFAHVCRQMRKTGVIFMPVTTPRQKIDKTATFGGDFIDIRLTGDFFDECLAAALTHADETGALMVPPFDHADIIEGQASVGHEIARQMPDGAPDMMILPVGGGGLIGGVALAFRHLSPDTKLFAVEPQGFDGMGRSLAEGAIEPRPAGAATICDGLMARAPGAAPFAAVAAAGVTGVAVADASVRRAMRIAFERLKLVLEPSGAAAIAALLDAGLAVSGKTVLVIATGGNVALADFTRHVGDA